MPQAVTLYQELIDLIIDEIAIGLKEDDSSTETLSACSLTSWSFHRSARKHLFQQISISHIECPEPEEAQMRLDNLIDIIESDPSRSRPSSSLLSSDIRSLRMELIRPPHAVAQAHSRTRIAKAQRRWRHLVSRLPNLLQHLSSVQKFILDMVDNLDWSSLDDLALLQFFALPSLTSLEFRSVNQLPIISIILCCENLRHLSLHSCTLMKNEDITTSALVVPLESLSIHISSSIPFGLSYFYNQPDIPEKDPSMSWPSLKSLTVAGIPADLFTIDHPGYRPVYLDLLPNLRRLELRLDSGDHLDCLTTLGRVLHHLPLSNLQELAIFTEWSGFELKDFLSEKSDCIALLLDIDAAITGPNLLSLTKVSLDVVVETLQPPEPRIGKILEMGIRKRLPSTSNSSKLRLNVAVDAHFVNYDTDQSLSSDSLFLD